MPAPTPFLWFASEAEEAATFYVSLFPGSRITSTTRYAAETPGEVPVGSVMTVDFELDGARFTALNGGHAMTFTQAISFQVPCASQEESDRLWAALTDGGSPGQCGWLQDRYGVSWQVFPGELDALLTDEDPERARRATAAMLGMSRIDLAAIRAAADGRSAATPAG